MEDVRNALEALTAHFSDEAKRLSGIMQGDLDCAVEVVSRLTDGELRGRLDDADVSKLAMLTYSSVVALHALELLLQHPDAATSGAAAAALFHATKRVRAEVRQVAPSP